MAKDSLKESTKKILNFRNARNWKQFHNPKDLAISLSLEASEVLEHFQWKSKEEIEKYIKTHKEHIGEKLADVFAYLLLLSHELKVDLIDAADKKIKKNAEKYPVKKSKGVHTKYTKL